MDSVVRARLKTLVTFGTGILIFSSGVVAASFYFSQKKGVNVPLQNQKDVKEVYDKIAKDFDSHINFSEWFSGIRNSRKKLMAKAQGDVLEVCVGTGRNWNFYKPNQVKSITVIDSSQPMIQLATQKIAGDPALVPITKAKIMDAVSLQFPDESFDTVVQTMGLCSTNDPIRSLKEMQRVCKKDGKILLIEHGLSSSYLFGWMNSFLNSSAEQHAEKFGCWWNRDILHIVESSGLKIEEIKKKGFGTFYVITASPNKQNADSNKQQ